MNLPDTNIWLALALSTHEFHGPARDWFMGQSGKEAVLFCRSTQHSFLRLLTTESFMRLYGLPAMTNDAAWEVMDGFLADARIGWAAEPRDVGARWKKLALRQTASPKLWMDAYLAAFALAGGYRVVTTDKAFTQFKELDPVLLTKNRTG